MKTFAVICRKYFKICCWLLLQTVVRGGEVQGAGVQQLSAAAGRGPRQPAGVRPLAGAQAAPVWLLGTQRPESSCPSTLKNRNIIFD